MADNENKNLFMPVTKRTFNLIFEFDENFSDDEIHRTIAKILL